MPRIAAAWLAPSGPTTIPLNDHGGADLRGDDERFVGNRERPVEPIFHEDRVAVGGRVDRGLNVGEGDSGAPPSSTTQTLPLGERAGREPGGDQETHESKSKGRDGIHGTGAGITVAHPPRARSPSLDGAVSPHKSGRASRVAARSDLVRMGSQDSLDSESPGAET